MTRRFLDQVRADINAAIIPNAAGLITADVLRPLMIDSIDSSVDDEAVIQNSAGTPVLSLNDTTWTVVPMEISVAGDANFLIIDLAGNKIISSSTAGFTYEVQSNVSLIGSNNVVVECAILVNSVPAGYEGEVAMRGNNRPQPVNAAHLSLSTIISSDFQVGLRLIGTASDDVEITQASMLATIKPTNNP